MTDRIGQMIDHFRLDALIGDGGMGTVYKAWDTNLDRPVAIKLMHTHFARIPEFRARLTQEAKTSAQLGHPSIVNIYDFGESEAGLYIAMEYVDGGSLRAHMRRLQSAGRYLPLSQSMQIGAQIADALDYAHRQRIIHRDVKPGNIILKRLTNSEEGDEHPFRAILTDFGLVKLSESEFLMTKSGTTLGTPTYMSPEQCTGEPIDGRSDLYSLGVVLYELVTNRLPFIFKTLPEAVTAHLRGDMPPAPREIRPDVPALVDMLLTKALAKSPADRFTTGSEMAQVLRSAMVSLENRPTRVMSLDEAEEVLTRTPIEAPTGYRLKITTPGHEPSIVELNRLIITLGRSADNDIVLPAEGVSRHHARLRATTSGWSILDLGGINGTFLDGQRVRANQMVPLRPGTRLQLGPYELSLEGPAGDAAAAMNEARSRAVEPTRSVPLTPPPDVTTPVPSPPPLAEPLALFLARERLTGVPGESVDLNVEIANRSDAPDRVSVRLEGVPSDWVDLPAGFIDVPARGSTPVTITVTPPRRSSTPVGRQRFIVQLVSQQNPDHSPTAEGFFFLGAYEAFDVSLDPKDTNVPGVVQVIVRNKGNAAAEFSINARDPNNQIRFDVGQDRITLQTNQSASVGLRLDASRPLSFGSPEAYQYEVEVVGRGGMRQMRTGRAQIQPMLPTWLTYGLIFVTALACFMSILFIAGDRLAGGQPTATVPATLNIGGGTPLADLNATQTAAAMTLTASAVTPITGDPDDRDGDGIDDALEVLPDIGSDPTKFDTDGDGLSDGVEAFEIGTSPTRIDTDGDGLTDGEEYNLYGTNPLDPDTDGDGVRDGVEVNQGTNPLGVPSATPTITSTPEPVTPSITPTPSDTPTPSLTPSITPTGAPTATPTQTGTPTATATATNTPTPTPTNAPTATATPTSTPTLTPTFTPTPEPNPVLGCIASAPVIDGTFSTVEWGATPLFSFDLDAVPARTVDVYTWRDAGNLYVALVATDPSNQLTDRLTVYFDVTTLGGDPDTSDRFFQATREGIITEGAGIGSNGDTQLWNADYTSVNWDGAVGAVGANQWVFELQVDLNAEMPLLANPFGMMVDALFSSEGLAVWPDAATSNSPASWQGIDNVTCP